MKCPTEGAECLKATSQIVRNNPCEYSDWRQRIQKQYQFGSDWYIGYIYGYSWVVLLCIR